MAKDCPSCRTGNQDHLKFCGNCGERLPEDVNPPKSLVKPMVIALLGVAVLGWIISSPGDQTSSVSRAPSQVPSREKLCDLLVAEHRSSLAATFEIEIRSGGWRSPFGRTLDSLNVYVVNPNGSFREPESVVMDVLRKVAVITDMEE